MTVKVKICGITRLEDALVAIDAGANYLGFILWPHSKRAIEPEATRIIVEALRRRQNCPILVGVFVDRGAGETAQVLDACGLDLAQLSGNEPPAQIGDRQSPLYGRSYKALRPQSLAEAEAEAEWYVPPQTTPEQPALLLDAYHPTLPGGTGRTTNWTMAARLRESVPRLMLAGGLTPENVAQAVAQVQPFAVDVASGVEATAGVKDHAKVRRFIQQATSGENYDE